MVISQLDMVCSEDNEFLVEMPLPDTGAWAAFLCWFAIGGCTSACAPTS